MRRVERIIERIRVETENEEYGNSSGISDNECIEYLNDAQDRIYSEIVKQHVRFFQTEDDLAAPVNTETLSLPARVYLGQLSLVEYSSTGNARDFYRLSQANYQERISYPVGNPVAYIRRNNELLFVPVPANSAGTVRLSYTKALPRLDKRRGKVSAVTIVGTNVTALTLDTAEEIDDTNLLKEAYLSVVSADGDLKMAGLPFSAIDTSTGVVTIDTSWDFETGESIAVGDYVVMGAYSCNRSQLQTICERYLSSHLRMEMLDRDANGQGTQNQNGKMEKMLAEIVASFADQSDDVIYPPVLDTSYLGDGWNEF
jgi:hypothetical protein